MTKRFITEPTVITVATNKIEQIGIEDWVEVNNLTEVSEASHTPLGKISKREADGSHIHKDADLIPEFAGRFCYGSWEKGRPTDEYIENILSMAHGSVLEHSYMTFAISGVSRALTHELIRHRAGFAVSQESQRYVNADAVKFVVPPILLELWEGDLDCKSAVKFKDYCNKSVVEYMELQNFISGEIEDLAGVTMKRSTIKKRTNEAARAVLPNCAETKLVWSGNLRALRHVLELRGSDGADLEIRRLQKELLKEAKHYAPHVFKDFKVTDGKKPLDFGVPIVTVKYPKV